MKRMKMKRINIKLMTLNNSNILSKTIIQNDYHLRNQLRKAIN